MTEMNHEDIMLSDINQTQKENTAWFHLYDVYKIVKLLEVGNRMELSRVLGEEEISSCFTMGMKSQLCQMEKFYILYVQ